MAIDILSILAMSNEPERVLSGGRRTVLQERIQIDPETLEKTKCLKNWHQRRTIRKIGNFSLSIQPLYSQGKVNRDPIIPYIRLFIPTVISAISAISAVSAISISAISAKFYLFYLVGVEQLRTGHFYPYRLRYFMHFLLDKGYFILAYSHYPKPHYLYLFCSKTTIAVRVQK